MLSRSLCIEIADKLSPTLLTAVEESRHLHTESEHTGILIWELDWVAERDRLLEEMAAEQRAT